MNTDLRSHLASQGIYADGGVRKPCWGCCDKEEFDRAEVHRRENPSYRYNLYWHPWHDGVTEMPEWSLLQRLLFRWKLWKPACLCRACNGAGSTMCYQMRVS